MYSHTYYKSQKCDLGIDARIKFTILLLLSRAQYDLVILNKDKSHPTSLRFSYEKLQLAMTLLARRVIKETNAPCKQSNLNNIQVNFDANYQISLFLRILTWILLLKNDHNLEKYRFLVKCAYFSKNCLYTRIKQSTLVFILRYSTNLF